MSDPGPPPPHARPVADDEVSLRELASILRRGLPAILVATVLAAAAALAWGLLAPDAYEARATVVSSPNQVRLGEDVALNFDVRGAIDVATLRSIAGSRSTYDAVRTALEADGVTPPDAPRDLEAATALDVLTGGDGGRSALTVVMRVTHPEPDTASAWANAWADATVARVRATLLDDLGPIYERTRAAVQERRAALDAAEATYRDAAARDLAGLERQLEAANARLGWLESDRAQLTRTLAGLRAEGAQGDPREIARLEGERRAVDATLDAERTAIETLRTDVADARLALDAAQRERDAAADAYARVQALEPALALVSDLTPRNTRLLEPARTPTDPVARPTVLVTALAAVVAALVATLVVFLREAIRAPEAPPPADA
ncbi:MAG: Wzz/FepE/Etk N-terminal domain-containing protein [Trueperaceae bacterium]|nr:Wzz/FepE/Etk N-terminal domain-containing protein [Trueperaceae bacterium]